MKQRKRSEVPPEGYLAAAFLSILIVVLSAQVIARFGFRRGITVAEEISRFAFVWAVYFGFVLAAERNKHIRVTLQLSKFSHKVQRIILTISDSLWLVFNIVLVVFSVRFVLEMIQFPFYSQTMQINIAPVYAIVPLGFGWMTVRVVQNMIRRFKSDFEIGDSRRDTA